MKNNAKNSLDWKTIGLRFKQFREMHNYTQSDISKLNNNPKNISEFEIGATPASTNYALFLRNEFGASFDWLYEGVVVDRKYEDVQKKRFFDSHSIGTRLKEIRKDKGMTLKEFGELVGLPIATVSNYEKGRNMPEIKTALKIKRALNKPLDWIYFGDTPIIPKKDRIRANANQIKSNQSSSMPKKKSRKTGI